MSKQVHHNILILKWFNFISDFRPYVPIAILYYTEVTGSYALGLSVFGIVTISSSIFEVPTGIFSDYIGRKKTMMYGSLFSTLALAIYAYANSYLGLAIGSIVAGVSFSLFSGNNTALLYDSLLEEKKENEFSKHHGKVTAMFQLGLAASALLGGAIGAYSFKAAMWFSVLPQIVALIIAFQFKEPKVHGKEMHGNIFIHFKEALKKFISNWRLRTLSITSVLNYGLGEVMFIFEPAFFATLIPVWLIGVVRTFNHLLATLSFYFAGNLTEKFGTLKTLFMSEGTRSAVYITFLSIPSFISPFMITLTSLNFGVTQTAQETLLQEEFTNNQRATMGSLNAFFGAIIFAIFTVIFGHLADIYGPAQALLIGAILRLAVLPLYALLSRKSL